MNNKSIIPDLLNLYLFAVLMVKEAKTVEEAKEIMRELNVETSACGCAVASFGVDIYDKMWRKLDNAPLSGFASTLPEILSRLNVRVVNLSKEINEIQK